MPKRKDIPIKGLQLDRHNFRTVAQPDEVSAINAMIAIEPKRLWALMESLYDDGFTLAENILVLRSGAKKKKLIVAEGNRRVAAMKLAFGIIDRSQFEIPSHIESKIAALGSDWKRENGKLPCVIYGPHETAALDREVSRIHGKGEAAGRDPWKAVAKARHNRDKSGEPQIDLDLLEAYLEHGKNISASQREEWAGVYPLTILDEALKKLAPRLGFASGKDFVASYPKAASHRTKTESILRDIGTRSLGFKELRSTAEDILHTKYHFPAAPAQDAGSESGSGGTSGGGTTTTTGAGGTTTGSGSGTTSGGKKPTQSHPLNDQRAVRRVLKEMSIKHGGREKVATLRKELLQLSIKDTPFAFCFVLRSVFEISAKAFCDEHKADGLSMQKSPGQDKNLVDGLRDIVKHATKNKADKDTTKKLQGAIAELGKSDGFLSITSMNQLVHHKSFSVNDTHICGLFFNIFPLLEMMNA